MRNIEPITRNEKYINQIVGCGNTAPETPQTREELFYAAILGEVVALSPITRAEKYLAKIANKYNGELPEPITRIERFLARAAGMDVAIPTPVTREEMFWADYALIVEKEISGIPPLTFNAIAGALKNYRIYGNTINGESVGDKTINLAKWDTELITDTNGNTVQISNGYASIIDTHIIDNLYLFGDLQKLNSGVYRIGKYSTYPELGISGERSNRAGGTVDVSDCNYCLITCNLQGTQTSHQDLLNEFMIVEGDIAPTKFEPYGYKIPVTLTAGSEETTDIYLDEPLAKSGNNADYIDYATQKRHNSDGTESSITLPEIAVTAGTNTLSVGTEVQPSDVYIKYEGAR